MVNKVILVGRLGRDPEIRYLDSQRAVAHFSLATSEHYRDKNGQKIEQTEWHDIELWDDLAKNAEKYLKKGHLVYIEGKIKTDHWKDKEGNERTTKKIRATSLTFMGTPGNGSQEGTANKPQETRQTTETISQPDLTEDLPF